MSVRSVSLARTAPAPEAAPGPSAPLPSGLRGWAARLPFAALLFAALSAGPLHAAEPSAPPIVGGTVAPAGAYPWQVGVLDAAKPDNFAAQFCGGTLIAPTWVVTAAHCVDGETAGGLAVLVGTNSLASGGTRIAVSQIIAHESYSAATDDNDIALLRLAASATQQTIGYLNAGNEAAYAAPGTVATITGWGDRREDAGDYPTELHQAQVPVVRQDVCDDVYNLTDNMLCAGFPSGGVDTCQGDSGGPLIVPAGSGFVLAGVTSFGTGCAREGYYGVYARVARYSDWIAARTGGGTDPDPDPVRPSAPVVLSPKGTIRTLLANVVWRSLASEGATRYAIELRRKGKVIFSRELAASKAGCAGAAAQCRFKPLVWLYGKGYSVRVRAYAGAWGPWSRRQPFTVRSGAKPAESTAMAVEGGRWTWAAVDGADRYEVVGVGAAGTVVARRRLTAADARCAAGTSDCRVSPPAGRGVRSWWVRAGAGDSWGPLTGLAAR